MSSTTSSAVSTYGSSADDEEITHPAGGRPDQRFTAPTLVGLVDRGEIPVPQGRRPPADLKLADVLLYRRGRPGQAPPGP